MKHWTERSVDDFLHRIASDFVTQLENKIESEPLSKIKLAEKLGVSKGRVSQILNNPGNLTLRMIIKCARALGMKVAIIAYDDSDKKNERGPVNSEIFRVCWENFGKPLDFWSLEKPRATATSAFELLQVSSSNELPEFIKKDSKYGITNQNQVPFWIYGHNQGVYVKPGISAKTTIYENIQ